VSPGLRLEVHCFGRFLIQLAYDCRTRSQVIPLALLSFLKQGMKPNSIEKRLITRIMSGVGRDHV
jgi:hypothetical protein